MGWRSLRATLQGIQDIKKALKKNKGGQTYLAGAVGCSRQTIWSLLQGNPTDCDVFMEVCTQLGLNWEKVAEPELPELEQNDRQDIDTLVREVRQKVQPYIQERCGTMRVLDMTQPIALGDIYTSVNILEKIAGRRGIELSELMRDVSPEKFDRFCLGDVRERRVPGLEAVETFSKLMILGKPGAGKTTFLKHLAIQCIGGTFQSDRVPVFITLKDFAEAEDKPALLGYITRMMPHNLPKIPPTSLNKGGNEEELVPPFSRGARGDLQQILSTGRMLVLLDGLDEVRDADSSQVLRQIQEFSQQFPQNQFVITCRIAAKEYTFEKFTEVEIADFDDKQIADFSGKWFRSKNDPIKAERFLQKLKEDEPIRELATNPLLLTLLCLVFEDSGSFPINRAELYQTGVDVLLKKWDVKRNIERDQVYKRLSLKRKEDLLSQIARTTFEAGNYFFKQREVERYINQYIQNLPDASTDPEALELDSVAVLKSIEAQHGLFVERARGIYSFSHLTFHEYFTARKIVTSCNPYAADDPMLQELASHVTEKRWREVLFLTLDMLDSAGTLLQLVKVWIDGLLAEEQKFQQFLQWVVERVESIQLSERLVVLRAAYISIIIDIDYRFTSLVSNKLKEAVNEIIQVNSTLKNAEELLETKDNYGNFIFKNCEDNFYEDFITCIKFIRQALDESLECAYLCAPDRLSYIEKQLDPDSRFYFELAGSIAELKDELDNYLYKGGLVDWWKIYGQAWTEQLIAVMHEYQDITDSWRFSNKQKELLKQYYDANVLLLDFLNSDCYVSREVRQEIEETLLLPSAEIKKRRGL